MASNNIEISTLTTMEELYEVQKVEAAVWNMDPIPVHQTFTALQNGGILLGAFDGKKMVGFLYSFPGFEYGSVHLCSHMLGILPAYQTDGLGVKMKMKQAKIAKELGYPLITWTFDPLESRNAYLNLHKLGATGAIYAPDHYGSMNDGLNQGLPSDRIQIKWYLHETKPKRHVQFDKHKLLLDVESNSIPVLTDFLKSADLGASDAFFVSIPMHFQAIKQHDFELAKLWRSKSRHAFQTLFKEGFQATDLLRDEYRSLSYYVFTR